MSADNIYATDDYPRVGFVASVDVQADGYVLAIYDPDGLLLEGYAKVKTPHAISRILRDWCEGKSPKVRAHWASVQSILVHDALAEEVGCEKQCICAATMSLEEKRAAVRTGFFTRTPEMSAKFSAMSREEKLALIADGSANCPIRAFPPESRGRAAVRSAVLRLLDAAIALSGNALGMLRRFRCAVFHACRER